MKGEEAVSEYLERMGHSIIQRNYKTRFCEIDIVSVCRDKIYFTEVKTRKNNFHGGGLYAVDKKKLERMKFAVESYLKYNKKYNSLNPQMAVADVDGDYNVLDWIPIH